MKRDELDLPIPRLRRDIEVVPVSENGEQFLLLHDPHGYGRNGLILHPATFLLLDQFDGEVSVRDLQHRLLELSSVDLPSDQILMIVQQLERENFLESDRFLKERAGDDEAFVRQPVRSAAFAGMSYPDHPEELRAFLAALFESDRTVVQPGRVLGVICPHIDLQVGPEVYVPAFRYLQQADFDTVVILGTSHHSMEDLFLLTSKDFETPLGTLPTDKEFVRLLHHHSGEEFTRRDVAFRREHSIEFPLLFLQHAFGSDRKIVPILVPSFDDCLENGSVPSESDKYRLFLDAFEKTVRETGRRVVFLLSVDWSHIGRKFGDDRPASELLPVIKKVDHAHLHALERVDYRAFYDQLFETQNASRIDGFSCITAFFDLAAPARGLLLAYDQWHEEERESGVTYASMAFFA